MQITSTWRSPPHPFKTVLPSGREESELSKIQWPGIMKDFDLPLLFNSPPHLKVDSSALYELLLCSWGRGLGPNPTFTQALTLL